ncbi:MAG: hypothetical protein R6W83_11415 [Cryobacterium sp.]
MNRGATYKAVLFGPNPISAGVELDLEYIDGEVQEAVVLESVDDGVMTLRTYRRGHHTEEPVPYRFVEQHIENDPESEPDIPN